VTWRPRFVGSSPATKELLALIADFAPFPYCVLITGPSGTGKELIARELHEQSPRRNRPFVALNCAAIPDSAFESELFGVAARSFTGVDPHDGLLADAEGGTLFLDEVGDLSSSNQAKLLRVLQEKCYRRVGSSQLINADVRFVAATNKKLREEIKAGQFREDLFYRLSQCVIPSRPLSEHREDIEALVDDIIARLNLEMGKSIQGISPEALRALQQNPLAGSVRELQNYVLEAMLREKSDIIQFGSLREEVRCYAPAPEPPPLSWEDAQRNLLAERLERHRWNLSRTARDVRMDRKTLRGRMRQYRLVRPRKPV
jgi:DNA-binding NtrC family response regulator